MKPIKTLALCSALALSSTAVVAANMELSDIEVKTDLSAYENSSALDYWPTLEADIAQEISEKVAIDDLSDAPSIRVEINKVAVNGETILADDGEFNQLEGTVVVMESLNAGTNAKADSEPGRILQSFAVGVSATTPDIVLPEGWVLLPATKDDFYNAMVEGYVDTALEQIEF
ncbi:hypothetical protein [Roseovarius sp. 2305UL8-3]|uniref:hypothetical protein n=1 Tax=Roseovarius conchicola TaxID=3121636 RepID=UPI00352706F5